MHLNDKHIDRRSIFLMLGIIDADKERKNVG